MASNGPWTPPGGPTPPGPPAADRPTPPSGPPPGVVPWRNAPPVPYVAPPAGYPYLPPPPVPAPLPRGVPRLRPTRIDPVPGTQFGVAIPALHPTVSGLAVGSMVAGIGSITVSLLVLCFGLLGADKGWGPLVAGAFAALAVALAGGASGSALPALREIKRSAGQVTGRGLAVTGLACGGTGLGLALLALLLAVALES